MSLEPEGYLPRLVDKRVDRYLRIFGAVEIAGTKWCGKTWTALRHAQSVSYVDENLALAQDDPSAMLTGERPHVIDEWQRVPAIWDVVRHEVDRKRGQRGSFILTGSSSPLVRKKDELPQHSGAGRVGRVRMRPMSLFESGDSVGAVSLAELFDGKFEPVQVKTTAYDLVNLACRGGWPEAIDLSAEDAQEIAREYLRRFRTITAPSQGKDPETMGRMLFSLARNLGQSATYKTLAADASDASAEAVPSESAVSSYLELLRASYVVDEVPGWLPPARSAKRIHTKPKRYLADPSLAVAQLALLPEALLEDWQTFGLVFENLCIRDLQVYAEAQGLCGDVPVRYYRDSAGLEIDAIIELADGRWAAFEIKTSEVKVPDGVASLKRLRNKLTQNPRARVRPPEFMAVITGVSEYAHRVEDGIYAIPIRALTA
ncbi:MAG: ATP-binding protein [Coriobacteriaceae bacterium]|nr:MAG: ATP-binding protein [Coriobacteriaceae bacterium]